MRSSGGDTAQAGGFRMVDGMAEFQGTMLEKGL
jgi:hypothetical protein